MNDLAKPVPDLAVEREQLKRALIRSTAAAVGVLLVAVGLSVLTAWSAARARKSQEESTENLWSALCAEANGGEGADSLGAKKLTLDAVEAAVAIRSSPELRDRAITALARTDLELEKRYDDLLPGKDEMITAMVLTPDFQHLFLGTDVGVVHQYQLPEGNLVASFREETPPSRTGGAANYLWISSDRKYLAMRYTWRAFVVWDVELGERIFGGRAEGKGSNIGTLAFHPKKPHLLYVSDTAKEQIGVVDLEERNVVEKIKLESRTGCVCHERRIMIN